jgi:tetratricopeptide (TPR) repeat protein
MISFMSFPSTISRVAQFSFRPLRLISFLWRWPKTTAVAVVLLGVAAGFGAHEWASSEERETRLAVKEERYPDARRHADHCLTVWRRSPSTYLLSARVARLQFDYPRAEADLRRSAELSGGSTAGTQLEWLLLRAQAGDADEVAPGLFRLVEENDPESPAILEALSGAYVRQMRLREAMYCLNLWLKREPDSVPALDRRGWTWDRLQSQDSARADWQRALELAPWRWETRLRLADLYLDENDPGEAQPHVEQLQKSHPERADVWTAVGRCRFLQGDLSAAEDAFNHVVEAAPNQPPGLLWRAKVALEKGQDAEAETWLRRAIEQDPYFLEAHFSLLQCLERQNGRRAEAAAEKRRYDALKADVEKLTSLMSGEKSRTAETAERCAEVGTLLLRLGRTKLARDWLERALRLDDQYRPAHAALADWCEQQGDAEGAKRERRLAEGQGP